MIARRAIVVAALLSIASCKGSLTEKANTTLSTALAATNAARDEFVRWDRAHQEAIVDAATTRDEAVDGLARYRHTQRKIVQAFTVAYSAIAAAAAVVPLVDAGKEPTSKLALLLGDGVTAVQEVMRLVREVKELAAPSRPLPPAIPDLSPAPAAPGPPS